MTAREAMFSGDGRADARPRGPRGWLSVRRRRLVATLEPGAVAFSVLVGARARRLGVVPLPLGTRPGLPPAVAALGLNARLELHLPAAAALRKTVRLPAAARSNLRAILALEMDRETPFGAEAVAFDHRILARDRGALVIELLVVPRRALDPALEPLARLGLAPQRITVAGPAGDGFNLAMPAAAPVSPRRTGALAGLVLALAAALFATDHWQAADRTARLERVQADADLARALQQRLGAPGRDAAALRQGRPPMTEVLAALTRALPDGTWLERLSITDGALDMTGLAPDAAALIPLLERTPPFRNVRFAGAVVRDMRVGRERFQITLDLAVPR